MAIDAPAYSPFILASWYRFVPVEDCAALRAELLRVCRRYGLRGTILLSPEGMNASVGGRREDVAALLAFVQALPHFAGTTHRETPVATVPFHRLKVRIKKEIISLGSALDPATPTGKRVAPDTWNDLLDDADVLVLDVRNRFEVGVGSFAGARDPGLASFREFPRFVREQLDPDRDSRVAMFCTGGIRCEKASAFMLSQGFEEIYQLEGGILRYLGSVSAEQSRWQGECFVFDQRVSVGHAGAAGSYEQCYTCRHPVGPQDRASPAYEKGVSCPSCFGFLDADRRRRSRERHRQVELAAARGEAHIGLPQAPPTPGTCPD